MKLTSAYDDVGAVKSDLSLPWLGKAGERHSIAAEDELDPGLGHEE